MTKISLTCLFIILLPIIVVLWWFFTSSEKQTVIEHLEMDRPNSFVHTECISMDNCKQRRLDLLNHMKDVNFRPHHFTFSRATTPENITTEYQPYTEYIKDTRLGCWLSHVDVWKSHKNNHTGPVLVLEDDVRFEPDFTTKLNKIVKALDTIDWDICMLGRRDRPDIEPATASNIPLGVCDLEIVQDMFDQTHCYLFNPAHLDKLLQLDPLNMDVETIFYDFAQRDRVLAIDTYLPHLMKLGHLTVLGVQNQLADQISSDAYDSTTN